MGSGGSRAAQVPDADSIRRETGCERGAGGGRAGGGLIAGGVPELGHQGCAGPEARGGVAGWSLSQATLLRLYHRFRALDSNKKGYLSRVDLQQIGALAVNPLGDRIIDSFFPDGSCEWISRLARVLAHFRPVDDEDTGTRDPRNPNPSTAE
ncbi:hypothetical protein QTO34_013169 [Cnephaeus nilssonii]|uniref:Uncharacterized protein n=1 Tax=Cnephaeus nilssonii TaxID=3371016 RepID=A0AA40I8P5_CNENI|nr:hypothetical protein QTO34_013169 [Eptesicus nilssonii]